MRSRLYLTAGALLFTILVVGILCVALEVFSSFGFRDREKADIHYEVIRWKKGAVGFADYSTLPGSYNWKLHWEGDDNEKLVMLEIGNQNSPTCKIGPNGRLYVIYGDGKIVSVFSEPSRHPDRTIISKVDRF